MAITLSGPSGSTSLRRAAPAAGAPAPAEAVDADRYSFAWTARHDDGPLPPAADNFYGHLVAALVTTKAEVEAVMTRELAAASAASGGASAPSPPAAAALIDGAGADIRPSAKRPCA